MQIELQLARRLWGASRLRRLDAGAPRAEGVAALLGMGHGDAAADAPAAAGLRLADDFVLGPHALPAVRTCHRVLLSCCVLGRFDEIAFEPLGFLAAGFGYAAGLGIGSLVQVPDAEACLFSEACQHALRSALRREPAARWHAVFDEVVRCLAAGRWPAGFGRWLGRALEPAIAIAALPPGPWRNRMEFLRDFEPALAAAPPPSLVALIPWVIALGDG